MHFVFVFCGILKLFQNENIAIIFMQRGKFSQFTRTPNITLKHGGMLLT